MEPESGLGRTKSWGHQIFFCPHSDLLPVPQEDKASRSKHLLYEAHADQASGACSTAKPGRTELLYPDKLGESRADVLHDLLTTRTAKGKGPQGFKPDRPRWQREGAGEGDLSLEARAETACTCESWDDTFLGDSLPVK